MTHTLNGMKITSDFLDSLEANNYFGNSDESEDIRGAWEDLVQDWPWWKDISDAQSDFFLNEAIQMVYGWTLEQIGSAAITAIYKDHPEVTFRHVINNFQEGDHEVNLWQDSRGNYFATTNGGPVFEEDFRNMGCNSLEEAKDYVWESIDLWRGVND